MTWKIKIQKTDCQKVVIVGNQKSEIVKITVEIIFFV